MEKELACRFARGRRACGTPAAIARCFPVKSAGSTTMRRIHILALFGLAAAAVAGCADTYHDRDDGYGRDGRRYCRDQDGDEFAC
jgi:hypothetical protein